MGWNNTKTNNGRKFQYRRKKKSDTYAYSASNLSGTQPKLACGKSSNCRYDWIRNFRFFFPCFGFFPLLAKFECHYLLAIEFFSVLAAIMWKNSDNTNDLRLRIVKALSFTLISGRVARRGSDASTADWRYQTHVKKYEIFSPVLSRLFSMLEILV